MATGNVHGVDGSAECAHAEVQDLARGEYSPGNGIARCDNGSWGFDAPNLRFDVFYTLCESDIYIDQQDRIPVAVPSPWQTSG